MKSKKGAKARSPVTVAEQRAAFADPNSTVQRAGRKRLEEMSQPWELVTLRLPPSLKAELEEAGRAAGRSLSGEMRQRLEQSSMTSRMLAETLGVVMSAVRAKVPHEHIERLIDIHMESLERKRL